MEDFYDVVMGRKSVRTYDGRALSAEDRERLEACISSLDNPFGVPVRFTLLDAAEHGLSSPVLTGETMFVAGTVAPAPHWEAAYGYTFEKLVLYAWSLGIGTVWIGGTMKRELFEKAAGLRGEERMPCMSPLGYPAKKRSIRESMMRKGVGADERKPLRELFFDGDFSTPLEVQSALSRVLEETRWAPSAVNKQPWRILRKDGLWHFYEKKDKGFVGAATGDLQRIDVGIALCHFMLGAEDAGFSSSLCIEAPAAALPENMEYVASVRLGEAEAAR